MSLILAIEPNKSQAHQLSALVRSHLKAELVTAATASAGLSALGDRIPDLILTPALLGLRDETALTERLRELGSAASHVQTLAVPILASGSRGTGGLLGRKQKGDSDHGCDPAVFAEQIRVYLQRASVERRAQTSEAAARAMSAGGSSADDAGSLDDSFQINVDELDVEGLDLLTPVPAPAPAPPVTPPKPAASAAPASQAAAPSEEAPRAGKKARPRSSANPTPEEEELGLVTPPTAGPPLWRVTESIEDFYGNGNFAEPEDRRSAEINVPLDASGGIATPTGPTVVAEPAAPPVAAQTATPRPTPRKPRTSRNADDWAYFDPSQSPFKALIERLDEIAGAA